MNYEAIKQAAEGYKADMAKFLRDMIAIPSESCEEEGVVKRIAEELTKLGYNKVEFDKLGNVIGWMGTGDKIIAIDSHIDTVGIGNRDNWEADPYQGYETDDIIYGRGGSDQEGGMAAAAYGGKIMKDLGLIPEGYKIMVVGSVQEEDCDGMCWQSIVNEYFNGPEDARNQIEFVISTEPTDGGIYRGHRGRMEIRVDMHGVSCHGSAPERGDNAIHKMAEVILNVRDLNENDAADDKEDQGSCQDARPEVQPRALGRRAFPRQRHLHHQPDLLHLSLPLRGCRLLLHLHRPPHDRRRDLQVLPEGNRRPARLQEVRQGRQGFHVHVRPPRMDWSCL